MQTSTVDSALLRPIDLADLGLWLRQHDFAASSAQLLTAARLLNGSRHLGEPTMLAAWLAPVFCSDLHQQTRFKDVYEQWLEQRPSGALVSSLSPQAAPTALPAAEPAALSPPAPVLAGKPDFVQAAPLAAHREQWRLARKKWLLLAVLLAVNLILWPNQRDLPRYLSVVKEAFEPAPVPAPRPDLPVPSASAAASAAAPAPPPAQAQPTVTYKINPIVGALLAVLLLASGAWWWYARSKQRAFLQRLPTDTAQERRRLRSANDWPHERLRNHARQLGINLRRPVTLPTPGLNVAATLAATLRAGGMPCPVFGSRAEPGYLVLIDSAGRGDHQAQLAGLVLDAMQNQGLGQDCYEFDADPRRSRHTPRRGVVLHRGLQSLSALASRHAGARLLIFSDGRGFIDPYTEDAVAWLSAFGAWEKPIMITPQARRQWGVREWRLLQSGLVLLPMDGERMQLLGQLFDSERTVPQMNQDSCNRLRPLYLRNVDLWLDQIAPSEGQKAQLLQALKEDFHSDGMAWLCACAVYPALYWRITVMLGEGLITDRERYAVCLAQIVRLPWMRAGFMPNWLREALLAELPPRLGAQVRQMLAGFLAFVFDDAAATVRDALQVAIAPGQRVRGQQHVSQARKDAVFLRFMSGKPAQLMADAGERLRQLLYRQGTPLAGPRRLPLVLAGLVGGAFAASALWVRVETVPDKPSLAAVAQASTSLSLVQPEVAPGLGLVLAVPSASVQASASSPLVPPAVVPGRQPEVVPESVVPPVSASASAPRPASGPLDNRMVPATGAEPQAAPTVLAQASISASNQPEQKRDLVVLPTRKAKRMALLIGNADYQYERRLMNPINDIRLLAKVFRDDLHYDKVVELTNLSVLQMDKAIDDFIKLADGADSVVFYFSGGGMMSENRENFLLPVDVELRFADGGALERQAVSAEQLERKLAKLGARITLLILDACRDVGPFGKSRGKGLAVVGGDEKGVLVAYATSEGKVASDGEGRNSPYAEALATALRNTHWSVLRQLEYVSDVVSEKVPQQNPAFRGRLRYDAFLLPEVANSASH